MSATGTLGSATRERLRFVGALLSKTADRFDDIEGFRLGAAFSYYATFAIFPLVLLTVTVVGFVIGDDGTARDRIVGALGGADPSMRTVIDQTLTTMQKSDGARKASAVIGVVSLLFSASGAFVELDSTLNKIWKVTPRTGKGVAGKIALFLDERLFSFVCVAGLGVLMLASLVASATLSFLADGAGYRLTPALLRTAEHGMSTALLAVGVSAAFHFVPRSHPAFRHVIPGAALTTALLTVLKWVFALYLSRLMSYSAYGIVGGVLALATWIYLSSQMIFFGATLTRIHCEMTSSLD